MFDPSISSTREAFCFPLHPQVAGGNYSYLKAESSGAFFICMWGMLVVWLGKTDSWVDDSVVVCMFLIHISEIATKRLH